MPRIKAIRSRLILLTETPQHDHLINKTESSNEGGVESAQFISTQIYCVQRWPQIMYGICMRIRTLARVYLKDDTGMSIDSKIYSKIFNFTRLEMASQLYQDKYKLLRPFLRVYKRNW